MLFAGVVSASSMWGTYKGNQIIKVKDMNGNELVVQDVPAISYQGRTMVPISMLKQLGVQVEWVGKTQTVYVTLPNGASSTANNYDAISIAKQVSSKGFEFVDMVSDGKGFIQITFYYNHALDSMPDDVFDLALSLSAKSAAESTRIIDINNVELSVLTDYIRDFKAGKITADQLLKQYRYNEQSANNSNSGSAQTQVSPSSYPELYSNDGKTFLGILTSNEFESDGVFNEFGTYGSKFSSDSIWNEFGDYGSKFSSESAFNKFASEPPIIVFNGKIIGYLTVNENIKNGISPYSLLKWLEDNGY